MTTLDQRILIPADPSVVWDYISSIDNNVQWQADCKNISFLTTFHKGQGTRYRYATEDDHEYVVEIIAWYEGLGYEYTIIDGTPFKSNRGRIRLQEIAEGTIVQWSFSYELGGLLPGMRNSMGVKRGVDNLLIDSLRALWKRIGQTEHSPKMLMRDAPDVEARAQYRPRHFSTPLGDDQATLDPPSTPESRFAPPADYVPSFISEPPVAEDDTRPTVAVQDSAPIQPAEQLEPDFLASISPFDDAPQAVEAPPEQRAPETDPRLTPVSSEVPPATTPPAPEKDKSQVDTGKISVFELFGLPKPSETQEVRIVDDQLAVVPKEPMPETQPALNPVEEEETPTVEPEAPVTADTPTPQEVPTATQSEPDAVIGQTPDAVDETSVQSPPTTELPVPPAPSVLPPAAVETASDLRSTPYQTVVEKTVLVSADRVGLRIIQRRGLVRLRRPKSSDK